MHRLCPDLKIFLNVHFWIRWSLLKIRHDFRVLPFYTQIWTEFRTLLSSYYWCRATVFVWKYILSLEFQMWSISLRSDDFIFVTKPLISIQRCWNNCFIKPENENRFKKIFIVKDREDTGFYLTSVTEIRSSELLFYHKCSAIHITILSILCFRSILH